jgi:hypothetical protein
VDKIIAAMEIADQRKRKHSLRTIIKAIFHLIVVEYNGGMLPSEI